MNPVARGKYLSLEEARKAGKLDQFAKEHPSEGDKKRFDAILDAMAHGESAVKRKRPKSSRSGGKT